jgi:hypothetical protein
MDGHTWQDFQVTRQTSKLTSVTSDRKKKKGSSNSSNTGG